jgi:hypothetical protein
MAEPTLQKSSQKNNPKNLTQQKLKELLYYDRDSGSFTRRVKRGRHAKGSVAGTINIEGYRIIHIENQNYFASRLAFLWMEGYFPEHQVDHKNRATGDDRWINLRHVTPQCNVRNRRIAKNNTSGVTGVSKTFDGKNWRAYIGINGSIVKVGVFEKFRDAVKARWNAEVKYDFPNCNTTSSALLFLQNGGC